MRVARRSPSWAPSVSVIVSVGVRNIAWRTSPRSVTPSSVAVAGAGPGVEDAAGIDTGAAAAGRGSGAGIAAGAAIAAADAIRSSRACEDVDGGRLIGIAMSNAAPRVAAGTLALRSQ